MAKNFGEYHMESQIRLIAITYFNDAIIVIKISEFYYSYEEFFYTT